MKFDFFLKKQPAEKEVEKEVRQNESLKHHKKLIFPLELSRKILIFVDFLCMSINNAIKSASFPSSLKSADVTPLHKKGRKDLKENFRPLSILPTLSNISEKCMLAHMSTFFDNIFSNQ